MAVELSLEWNVQHLCKEGEKNSGDLFIVKEFPNSILVSVIDSLGHGKEAYNVSTKSIKFISEYVNIDNSSLNAFFLSINTLLHGTRGAVMSTVIVNKRTAMLTWAGIGNVEGILYSTINSQGYNHNHLLLQNGIIGFNMPEIKEKNYQLKGDEVLMLFTDGISNFNNKIQDISYKLQYYSIKSIAKQIFNTQRDPGDDALFWIGKFTWNQ